MVGVSAFPASAWAFTDPGSVGPAEELKKATGVCVTGPAGLRDRSTERAASGQRDGADVTGLAARGGKPRVARTDGLLLRGAAERVGRCSSHNNLGSVSFSLHSWIPCEQLDMRIKSRIVRVLRY